MSCYCRCLWALLLGVLFLSCKDKDDLNEVGNETGKKPFVVDVDALNLSSSKRLVCCANGLDTIWYRYDSLGMMTGYIERNVWSTCEYAYYRADSVIRINCFNPETGEEGMAPQDSYSLDENNVLLSNSYKYNSGSFNNTISYDVEGHRSSEFISHSWCEWEMVSLYYDTIFYDWESSDLYEMRYVEKSVYTDSHHYNNPRSNEIKIDMLFVSFDYVDSDQTAPIPNKGNIVIDEMFGLNHGFSADYTLGLGKVKISPLYFLCSGLSPAHLPLKITLHDENWLGRNDSLKLSWNLDAEGYPVKLYMYDKTGKKITYEFIWK